jgi:hypothetical protein
LENYEALLKWLNDFESTWRALPSEVAEWWRQRNRMRLTVRGGDSVVIEGPGAERAMARQLSDEPLAQ